MYESSDLEGGGVINDATATPDGVFLGDVFYNNNGRQVGTNPYVKKKVSMTVNGSGSIKLDTIGVVSGDDDGLSNFINVSPVSTSSDKYILQRDTTYEKCRICMSTTENFIYYKRIGIRYKSETIVDTDISYIDNLYIGGKNVTIDPYIITKYGQWYELMVCSKVGSGKVAFRIFSESLNKLCTDYINCDIYPMIITRNDRIYSLSYIACIDGTTLKNAAHYDRNHDYELTCDTRNMSVRYPTQITYWPK